MLKVIFFGDISGEPGRTVVKRTLPGILESEKPDLVFANVDNLAHGKGVTTKTLEQLIRLGVNGFTSGNHVFSKKDLSFETFEKHPKLIVRVANVPEELPGLSAAIFETSKGKVLLGHFLGQVFMDRQFHDPISSPFEMLEPWLKQNKTEEVVATIIDFHAEVTSEKVAFGYFADGKVSAVLGTHTHIPTADAKILNGGTAYITDVGMCGAADSVLGVKKELALERFLTGNYVPFDIPENPDHGELSYVIIEIDEKTGTALKLTGVHKIIDL